MNNESSQVDRNSALQQIRESVVVNGRTDAQRVAQLAKINAATPGIKALVESVLTAPSIELGGGE